MRLLLSHFQRARSRAFAVVPLLRAASTRWLSVGDKRGRSKELFLLCSTEHPSQTPHLPIFHVTQRTGLTDEVPSRQTAKDVHEFPRSCCNCTVARLASRTSASGFLQSREL